MEGIEEKIGGKSYCSNEKKCKSLNFKELGGGTVARFDNYRRKLEILYTDCATFTNFLLLCFCNKLTG